MAQFMIKASWQAFKAKISQNQLKNHQAGTRNKIILLAFLISICGVCYLWQVNSLATSGYQMNDLEDKIYQLRSDNKNLELQITDLRSAGRINNMVKELKMEEVARVEYLTSAGTVAYNR